VVTYTSLLTCFASAAATGIPGDWVGRSLEVLGTMRAAGVAPTAVTALVLIDTCAKSVRALRRGSEEGRSALERLRRVFQQLDHNGDGRVSVGELRVASEKRTKLGGRLRDGQPQQKLGASDGSGRDGGGADGRAAEDGAGAEEAEGERFDLELGRFFGQADADRDGCVRRITPPSPLLLAGNCHAPTGWGMSSKRRTAPTSPLTRRRRWQVHNV